MTGRSMANGHGGSNSGHGSSGSGPATVIITGVRLGAGDDHWWRLA